MDTASLNQLWAELIVEELARCGIQHFIVAPGSRSTPLAVAAARNKRVVTLVHYDERGAAFAALGCGKAGYTAGVICTSGTAVANCFPAVAEARQSATPLVILSADRPPELQGCGANQTMEQDGLFGNFVISQEMIPCPDAALSAENLLANINALAAAAGTVGQGGPVHLNCMYREPLAPKAVASSWPDSYLNLLLPWKESEEAYIQHSNSPHTLSSQHIQDIQKVLSEAQQGLLLIGQLSTKEEQQAARALTSTLPWPVFADITSNCRSVDTGANAINSYDALLRSERFRSFCIPDVILHIGDVFVSKRLQEHIGSIRPEYIHLSSRNENRDPTGRVTKHYHVDITCACRQLTERGGDLAKPSMLLEKLQHLNRKINPKISRCAKDEEQFSELTIAATLNAVCTTTHSLFIGNSMPIRDMDTIIESCDATIYANRGVSGIDGNIATAAGIAWASGKPVIAVMGDMTALHDLNSLVLLNRTNAPLILLIVNNGGGGIFSFLPIAEHKDVFEPYFTNTHDLRFEKAAALFDLFYACATNRKELEQHLKNAISNGKSTVIEVTVDCDDNVKAHHELAKSLTDYIEGFPFH